MSKLSSHYGGSILIESISTAPRSAVEVMECKGRGHPDTLADDLAEQLSRDYSDMTLRNCGAVLHHNFDKLCLLGGHSTVGYGYGQVVKPVRVLVNGRASGCFANSSLKIEELIHESTRRFFRKRLPLLGEEGIKIELNLSTASSPGAVNGDHLNDNSSRQFWFNPRSLDDLRERTELLANDTSLGTGYAPLSPVEQTVRELAVKLSEPGPEWRGFDVKVMACAYPGLIDIVLCVPQIASFVANRQTYLANCEQIVNEVRNHITERLPKHKLSIVLNNRDKREKDEVYLTAVGSSIESGDEGVVGRGNRVNGLITPTRPMNMEGASGKNPVYHVGKLYNVLAIRIAEKLSAIFCAAVEVHLISATGAPLLNPWRVLIRSQANSDQAEAMARVAQESFSQITEITADLIAGRISLS